MAEKNELQHGDTVKDTISGFIGIVVAVTEWINGCVRLTIAPTTLKDGALLDNQTFDVEQLKLVKAGPRHQAKPTGGPKPSPTRQPDPTR